MSRLCPCCAGAHTRFAFSTPMMPVAAALMVRNADDSRNLTRRVMDLWRCQTCGFIWNTSFEPDLVRYDADYEGTQIHSPHFSRYLGNLAARWAKKFSPDAKTVVEVGCGHGEFLAALAGQVNASLVGYDPALKMAKHAETVSLIADKLPEFGEGTKPADVVISRMTLEHISDPASFLALKRRWLATDGLLITQVPNAAQTLKDAALLELQYEHVNYFTSASLIALMHRARLKNSSHEIDYNGQHLTVFAQRGITPTSPLQPNSALGNSGDIDRLQLKQRSFPRHWHNLLSAEKLAGRNIWLWGAGSRATAFCAQIPDPTLLAGVADVNPARKGSFVPGTAVQTVLPDHLRDQSNLSIIIMNPVYQDEIRQQLANQGINAKIHIL